MKLPFLAEGLSVDALRSHGLSYKEARAKEAVFSRVANCLIDSGAKVEEMSYSHFVPGRIEILGKHTDYGGGKSIVCSVEYGFCSVAVPRKDSVVTIHSVETGERMEFQISEDLVISEVSWQNYPLTVLRRMARNFGQFDGLDIAFFSDLPQAAGLSSSSAFMISIFLAVSARNKIMETPAYLDSICNEMDLASYLGTVENGQDFGSLKGDMGVGTFGGSEDHTAIMCSVPGKIGLFGYCPARLLGRIDISENLVFAICFSGVTAKKTGAARDRYNQAALQLGALVDIWRTKTGGDEMYLADILRSSDEAAKQLKSIIADTKHDQYSSVDLLRRLNHFIIEDGEIINAAVDALQIGDLNNFGFQVDRSHQIGAGTLGNQVPETIDLARVARMNGARAASSFGAGYGGAVWALVESEKAEDFVDNWRKIYSSIYPEAARRAHYFISCPGPAAFSLVD